MMKRFLTFLILYCCIIAYQGVHYEEGTFFKYKIILTKKSMPSQSNKESIPMILNGTKFTCNYENEESLLNRYSPRTNIDYFRNSLTNMSLGVFSREWMYHLQVNEKIVQYHVDNLLDSYILGYYSHDNVTKKKIKGFDETEQVYFTQTYLHGNICKTTGEERRTEVVYICRLHGDEEIQNVIETSSCNYVFHVFTPRICLGYEFESVFGHPIFCSTDDDNVDLNELRNRLGFPNLSQNTDKSLSDSNDVYKNNTNEKLMQSNVDKANNNFTVRLSADIQKQFLSEPAATNLQKSEKLLQDLVIKNMRRLIMKMILSKEKTQRSKSLKLKSNQKDTKNDI